MKLSGVMFTYVVVLLQFCERSNYSFIRNKYGPTLAYSHCFFCNETWS